MSKNQYSPEMWAKIQHDRDIDARRDAEMTEWFEGLVADESINIEEHMLALGWTIPGDPQDSANPLITVEKTNEIK